MEEFADGTRVRPSSVPSVRGDSPKPGGFLNFIFSRTRRDYRRRVNSPDVDEPLGSSASERSHAVVHIAGHTCPPSREN